MCRTKTDEQLGNVREPPSTAPPRRGAKGRLRPAHQAPCFLLTLKPEVLGDGLTPGKRGCPGPPPPPLRLCPLPPRSRGSLPGTCLLQTGSASAPEALSPVMCVEQKGDWTF